ncbi:MAG: carboxypeptidase-like regulatory domain-containing protein [Candidatus Acidiferrales bacterium]
MILKRLIFVAVALLLGAWWNPALLEAQTMTTGSVRGVVTNPKKAIVPNAEVLLTNNAKGTIQTVKTNLSGGYQFGLLDPGSYTLTVTTTGFQPMTKIVTIPLGEPVTVDFQLSLQPQGPVRAQAASLLRTENGNVGTTITRQQITGVPNPGNDMTYLAQFAPGTVMNTTGEGTGNFSNYGMPATSNRFSVDGLDEEEPFLNINYAGATKMMLGTNEVQDASIVSNGYTGTYREFAGAGVDYVTSSGGNRLHGNANYFWNQRLLNANNFFNNQADVQRPFDGQNQWQGSLGGPLKKDKIFFFINTEGLRVLVPANATVVFPSQDFQTASVAYLNQQGQPNVADFYSDSLFALINNAPNFNSALDNQAPGVTTLPGTNLQVPTGDGCGNFNLDPAFYGSGAEPCADSLTSSRSALTTEWLVDARIDVNLSAKDRMFGRYQRDDGRQATYIDPISSSFDIVSTQPEDLGQFEWTHDFGPSAANQFLVGTQWYSQVLQPPATSLTGTSFPTTIAVNDGTFFSTAGPNPCVNPPIGQGVDILLGGENCDVPQGRATTDFGISDDFSKVMGSNTIKIGGQFRRIDVSDHDFGTFQSGLLSVNTINDFFAGGATGDSLTQSFPQSLDEPIAYYTSGGYAEDDWRFSKTLSFTFAFRVEHDSDPICRHLCFAQLAGPFSQVADLGGQNESQQLALIPYNQAIKINQLQAMPSLQSILYEPRFSFAWQPFGASGKTVVRGGAGIFYNLFPPQIADNFAQNPPLDATFMSTNNYIVPIASAQGGSSLFADTAASNTAFQNGFYTGETLSTIEQSDATQEFRPPSLFSTEAETKVPQYQKWSLEVQRQLGPATSVTLSYVGNHGVHEPVDDNSVNAFGFANLPSAQADQRFGEVSILYSGGNSNYNGGTISVTHHISGWGSGVIQGSYTYSHALDEVSNGDFAAFSPTSLLNTQDPFNTQGSYGPADYDVRQAGSVNGVWDLPVRRLVGKHGSNYLVDGWQLSGAFFMHTGFPYSVVDGTLDAELAANNNYFSQVLPLFLGGPKSCQVTGFGPSCLAVPNSITCAQQTAAGCEFNVGGENAFTTEERNSFRGPGFWNFDAALMKSTRLPFWESARLAFGVQVYNVLNHPNFGLPVNNAASPEFGEILNTVSSPTSIFGSFLGGDGSPRSIQLKAQFTF